MASKSRPGVVIYFEFAHAMAQLDDADAGRLIKGLMEYAEHGVAPEFDSVLAFAWAMIKPRIDADAEHYAEICEKNAARARKRWERLNTDECQRIPEYAADANSTPTTAPTTALTTVKAGLSAVDKMYLDVGTVFNATPTQRLFKIAIPSSLDAIFAGVRTSTSAAWMAVLAAEMLGAGDSGVGLLISRGMDSMDMPLVLTGMIAIGIVGALLAVLTQFAERLICPWTRKTR